MQVLQVLQELRLCKLQTLHKEKVIITTFRALVEFACPL